MIKKWIIVTLVAVCATSAFAGVDLKQESESKFEFKGMLGMVMKIAGASDTQRQIVYLKDDLLREDQLDKKGKVESSRIIDLAGEVIYTIDYKKKKYTKTTFAEWKEFMESTLNSAGNKESTDEGNKDETAPQIEWKFDVKVDKTGNKKTIAGYDAEEVVITMKAEGQQTAESAQQNENGEAAKGGIIVESTNWISRDAADLEAINEFRVKFAQKMGLIDGDFSMKSIQDALKTSNPGLAAALEKLNEESQGLEGVTLASASEFKTWQEGGPKPEKAESSETEIPTSVGGLLGGFGKKLAKKKPEDEAGPKTVFTMNSETTGLSDASLDASIFGVPAKFKLEESPMNKKK